MKTVIKDFNEKVEEINEYFSFVVFIDGVETHKKEKLQVNSINEFIPNRNLQKILRSNCYLLLYNLVESTIRNAILSVYDSIHDDFLKFNDLSERIQEIWIANQTRKAQITDLRLRKWLKDLINKVSNSDQIVLEKETINISGNLDYINIERIINSYGFHGKISGIKKEIESALNKVKRERNLLAHGNKTFSQSGEIVTMSELNKMKEDISIYIYEVLINVQLYVDKKKYKK
jgi:hypothetical protein